MEKKYVVVAETGPYGKGVVIGGTVKTHEEALDTVQDMVIHGAKAKVYELVEVE